MVEAAKLASVRVTPDRMQVLVDCAALPEQFEAAAAELDRELGRLRIANAPDVFSLKRFLMENFREAKPIEGAVLIFGTPPTPPVHGGIEWLGEFFTPGFRVDEQTGQVDYRQRNAQPEVHTGKPLARLLDPVPGVEGVDVYGKKVPPPKPKSARLVAGRGVRLEEDTATFYSTADGRVRRAGDKLEVDEVLGVNGSVGLETGNIDHFGALVVQKDICPGAKVTATGDIEVHGVIDHAEITAGGNLTVNHGISSSPGILVKAAGNVHARHIMNTHLEAAGDVEADKEIVQSIVYAGGVIRAEAGRIVGGECRALNLIEVRQAGTEGVTLTHLTLTGDPRIAHEIQERRVCLKPLEDRRAQIHAAIDPLLARHVHFAGERQHALDQLTAAAEEIDLEIAELHREIAALHEEEKQLIRPQINVHGIAYAEVIFTIGDLSLRIEEDEVRGPFKVVEAEGQLQIMPLHAG